MLTERLKKMLEAVGLANKRAFQGMLDFIACGILLSTGALIPLNLFFHHQWNLLVLAVSTGILCWAMLMRNYSWRRLIDAQAKLAELLVKENDKLREILQVSLDLTAQTETENCKLKDIALSAIALKINIESGFTPHLHALDRDLQAYNAFKKSVSTKHVE
jgi:hypothetical protein